MAKRSYSKNKKIKQKTDNEETDDNIEELKIKINNGKKKKSGGGFQSMGFCYPVLKAILRKGYKIPTPIQRKTIPLILCGKDVVAMGRTGSGKSAAFILPLIEKLGTHVAKTGSRAIILSPTRELALQTYKFTKEFSRFTDLKSIVVLGGDSMDKQFADITDNPDIIIATPGRFLHVITEMNLKLSSVEYVVFDEADRLFEMGFQEQMNEILSRLPQHRQTLLFSATLPQMIADFTKARLNDPILIRLDTETKLSENLKTVFLQCRNEDKIAILLHLIKNIIKDEEMTVVFVPTRHHIEYMLEIFSKSEINCTYLYSSLDQEARKLNITAFQKRQVMVLLVTDVAARGVDIPMLDNVINFNFPAKPKLFVHRVGRVARAGRIGTAYSLIANDESPFIFSLHLFLNTELKFAQKGVKNSENNVYGAVPQSVIDDEYENLEKMHNSSVELENMKKVCNNAYKQYLKSRPSPDGESVKNSKQLTTFTKIFFHPIFNNIINSNTESLRYSFLSSIKNYRPNSTIFETSNTKQNHSFHIMQNKRKFSDKIINKFTNEKRLTEQNAVKYHDNQFYLPYQSNQHYSERGLEIDKSFNTELASAVFDISGDDANSMKKTNNALKWDRKKKRFITNDDTHKIKKIKTESGNWISASYKTDLYKRWKEKSKAEQNSVDDDEDLLNTNNKSVNINIKTHNTGRKRLPRRELKTKEEIYKNRQKEEKKKSFQKWRQSEKAKKKNMSTNKSRH